MKDYYYLLGIHENSSKSDIRKAYMKLSNKLHPDKNDGDLFFNEFSKQLNEAYEILSDSVKRTKYNSQRAKYQNAQVDKLKAEIVGLRVELEKLSNKLTKQANVISNLSKENMDLNDSKKNLATKLNDQIALLNLSKQNHTNLKEHNKTVGATLKAKSNELENSRQELSELRVIKAKQLERISELEKNLKSKNNSLEKLISVYKDQNDLLKKYQDKKWYKKIFD